MSPLHLWLFLFPFFFVSAVRGGWDWSLNPPVAPATSGTFSWLPVSPQPGVDLTWWDIPEAPVTFEYSTVGGEPIAFAHDPVDWRKYIAVDLDPDGNGFLPTEVLLNVIFPYPIHTRNTVGLYPFSHGSTGVNLNILDLTADLALTTYDGAGALYNLSSANAWQLPWPYTGTETFPDSYSGGVAIWQSANKVAEAPLYGLDRDTTLFTYGDNSPSKTISKQTWKLTNLSGGTELRLSVDGGVSSAVPIPEPSAAILVVTAMFLSCCRRVRK